MKRLEKGSEKHTVAKLPCCGAMIEITDPTKDNYVICPNEHCRTQHVVLSGLKHQIRSQEAKNNGNSTRLIY